MSSICRAPLGTGTRHATSAANRPARLLRGHGAVAEAAAKAAVFGAVAAVTGIASAFAAFSPGRPSWPTRASRRTSANRERSGR